MKDAFFIWRLYYISRFYYKRTVIVSPFPVLFSALILPLCACTIACATDKPIPEPPVPDLPPEALLLQTACSDIHPRRYPDRARGHPPQTWL